MIRNSLQQFYDNVADKFSQTRKNWWQELNFITKYVKSEDHLLDFGCGNGRLLESLKEQEKGINDPDEASNSEKLSERYVGVDISGRLIELAKKKYPGYKFLAIADERKLPFKDAEFDAIVAIAVFHHFTPEMAKEALVELRRILKKDGIIIITAWFLWNKKYLPFLMKSNAWGKIGLGAKISFDCQPEIFWRFCYWWSKARLQKTISQAGFQKLENGYTFDKNGGKRNMYFVVKKV